MKRIKVGVIGCGVMGGFHVKQYRNIPTVDLVGAADIDQDKAPIGIRFYKDYKELLDIVDAVSITTPTSTHYKIGMDALRCGCHVIIEKPIAETVGQGRKLAETAREKRLVLSVGLIERFNPAFVGLISELGRKTPDLIDIKRMSPFPKRMTDVSCVLDMMIHDIDLSIKLAKSEVKYINAAGKKIRTKKLDTAVAVLVFKNGVVANIEASRVHSEKVRRIVVARDASTYEADLLNRKIRKITSGKHKKLKVDNYDQLNHELKDFISAISTHRKPTVTGKDGLYALDIARKIEELAARHKC